MCHRGHLRGVQNKLQNRAVPASFSSGNPPPEVLCFFLRFVLLALLAGVDRDFDSSTRTIQDFFPLENQEPIELSDADDNDDDDGQP
jgi:hypothetical protein